METLTIVELINGVGFPIAVSVALFFNSRENSKNFGKIIEEFRITIHENTETLKKLSASIEERKK